MTTSRAQSSGPRDGPRHVGPPMLPLALIATGLFVASLVVGAAGGGPFPSPYDPASDVLAFFAGHQTTVRVSATLQFAAAVPLAVLAASLSSRVRSRSCPSRRPSCSPSRASAAWPG